jgi:hypothetical protein
MTKQDAVVRYRATLAVYKSLQKSGLLLASELCALETMLCEKCGLSLSSIYRDTDLIKSENRATIGSETT